MEFLSNAFSVLGFEDGNDPTAASTSSSGKSSNNGKSSSDELVGQNGDNRDQKIGAPVSDLRLPLVWIDLEMTGLNIEVDRILEIACIITDGKLSKSVEGPNLVIHQTQECLDRMGEWCQDHHGASGLTKKVLRSTVTEREAEKQIIEFVKRHISTYTPLLAGNSVYVDFLFLKWNLPAVGLFSNLWFLHDFSKYMPDLARIFSHVLVDVSSIKALCIRWYPRAHRKAPAKEQKHRAMDDIQESIMELKYYREHIFIKPSNK